jgi:hypothetical protein
MKRIAVALGLVIVASAAPAAAAPNPNPHAPAHTGTACANVLAHNPNTGPNGHSSPVGSAHFAAVGAAMCGLPG